MRAVTILTVLLLGLTACSREAEQAPSVGAADAPAAVLQAPAPMASSEAIAAVTAHPAWLRDHLPADTIAYVRVPAPWALLGAPSGRGSDPMYASAAHVEALREQREGLLRDPLVAGLGAAPLKLLMAQASPLEIAVLGTGGKASPGSNVVASVRLHAADASAAAALIGELIGNATVAFDADGYASLEQGGLPLFLHFDQGSARVLMLGGMYASADALRGLVAQLATPGPAHAMKALEGQIDESGQGLLVWVDVPALKPMLELAMQPQHEWARPLLEQGRALALGFGSAGGKGRLALRMAFERSPWADFAPSGPFSFDFDSAGRPRWVVTGALPTATQLTALLELITRSADPDDDAPSVAQINETLVKVSGLDLAGWMAPYGREWIALSDEAGTYSALRLSDPAALERVLAAITAKTGQAVTTHEYHGERVHHLRLPSWPGLAEALSEEGEGAIDPDTSNFLKLYARLGSHVYWYEQDGWLIGADLPQPLMARIDAAASHQPLGKWLEGGQGTARPQALISASTELEGISQTIYHLHLSLLQTLSGLSDTPLDLFRLPTAAQLRLPRHTGIGAELVMDEGQLALEMNYEHSPLEALFASNSTTAVAMVGIVAAVALPAYQEYTLRAQVVGALAETADIQQAVTDYYRANEAMPEEGSDIGLELPRRLASDTGSISLEGGAIFVHFSDADGELNDAHIYLLPELDSDGEIQWACGDAFYRTANTPLVELSGDLPMTDVPAKLLPPHCR